MSSWYSGLQARVKMELPKALYVHCYAHCLYLVLVDATKSNKRAFWNPGISVFAKVLVDTVCFRLFSTSFRVLLMMTLEGLS